MHCNISIHSINITNRICLKIDLYFLFFSYFFSSCCPPAGGSSSHETLKHSDSYRNQDITKCITLLSIEFIYFNHEGLGKYKNSRLPQSTVFVSLCFPESFKMHIGRSSDSSLFLKPSHQPVGGQWHSIKNSY
jgi:hypothetical protein